MGRELTRRYSTLMDRKEIVNPFRLARDLYQYGKFSELGSFLVWEMRHHLGLFPKEKYLKFSDNGALALESARLNDSSFDVQIERLFRTNGMSASRCAHDWKLLFIGAQGVQYGCIYPSDRDLYATSDNGESVNLLRSFPAAIKSIYMSSQNTIFVCIKGSVYQSLDHGKSFEKSVTLGSSESFFRNNNAMTETPDGTLVIAEYGNVWNGNRWKKLAYLYFSSDEGSTWVTSDFLIQLGTNKHVHLVKYSPALGKLFMADGDNKKKLWVTDVQDPYALKYADAWTPVNRFHIQMGGYTSAVEHGGKMLFGTDYQGGTNFIVETKDGENYDYRVVPDPYRKSPIDNMVQRRSKTGNELWANLPYSTAHTRCLLMYTADGGESWNKVFEYNRATHKVWLISSSNEIADELYLSIEDLESSERAVYRIADR